jgi:oligopeptidase B
MNKISPPRADRRPVVIERHDERIEDPYAWLRDERWQDVMRSPELLAPDIRTYLDAENRYAEATLAPTATLQARLFAEIKARIKEDDSTVPAPDGPFAYYRRFAVGGQHPILCRYRAEAGEQAEEILLNGDEEAEGLKYLNLTTSHHSPDHAILAYAVDLNGSEFFAIRFRDLATGRPLDDEIPNTHGSFAWANDSRTVFYTVLDESHRPLRVFRHVLGTPVDADALVYEETGPGFFVDVDKTESGRFIPRVGGRRPATAADEPHTRGHESARVACHVLGRTQIEISAVHVAGPSSVRLGGQPAAGDPSHGFDRLEHRGRPHRAVQSNHVGAGTFDLEHKALRWRPVHRMAVFAGGQLGNDGQAGH